jgi:trans-aconitate 2-methyltransferase
MSDAHPGQIAGNRWDPNLYLRFSDHRLRPALELLDRVPLGPPEVICDLGCGSGQVTRLIAERWPTAAVYGIDNSKEMLAQAAIEPGNVQWVNADIRTWSADKAVDLIYSNATLHWLEEHRTLFPRLLQSLKAGGCLAVQMPLSWEAPSLENSGPNGKALGTEKLRRAVAQNWVHDAQWYYDLLAGYSSSLDIWETEYLQVLQGSAPVLEWVKGTGLRPILHDLGDHEREIFLEEYSRRLRIEYPARADGRTLYPFRRLFIVATV